MRGSDVEAGSSPVSLSVEALWKMPEVDLLSAYYDCRRQFVEKKFARDTQRARLAWLRARAFVTGSGGVTERMNAVDASEEFGRKGQEVREMTRDVDLLKADVDLIAMIVRWRGAPASGEVKVDGEEEDERGTGDHP
jgi:hypothetical protein